MSKFWKGDSDSSSSSSDDNGQASADGSWDDGDQGVSVHQDFPTESSSTDQFASSISPDMTWRAIKNQQIFRGPLQSTNAKPPNCTRLVCISDTHSHHRQISYLPAGDVLIHAGDFSLRGELHEIEDLCEYFKGIADSYEEIIAIAGNHDRVLHCEHYLQHNMMRGADEEHCKKAEACIKKRCVYLKDSSHKLQSGMEVYGSPWTPEFCGWAFMLDRGDPIREKWRQIPTTTDVLITHGPPLGRGDHVPHAGNVGCFDLMQEIQQRVMPRVNIFGHIHEGYGSTFDGTTLYVNASSVDIRYVPLQFPVVIDLPHDPSMPAMVVPPVDNGTTLTDIANLCESNGWSSLKSSLDGYDLEDLMKSHSNTFSLLDPRAFISLCGSLRLKRQGQVELAQALRAVHALSFPR